jgi:ERCC4-related helicase
MFIGSDGGSLPEPGALLSIPTTISPPASKYALKPEVEGAIRDYQWELAQPGLSGQNYIVCAPTGSGKTRVAGLVISQHLRHKKGRGKVLFVVNKVPLVQQQRSALQAMIQGAKLEEVSGDVAPHKKAVLSASLLAPDHHNSSGHSSNHTPSKHLSPSDHASSANDLGSLEGEEEETWFNFDNDIIVCTAGCLFNELSTKKISLAAVSLLVIDECHNTRKNSDYAKIMEVYIRAKLSGEDVPQVMGLTATPGAGDAARPTISSVLDHLVTFCAAIDAEGGIKIVTRNTSDLKLHQASADHATATLDGRDEEEVLIVLLVDIMVKLEELYKLKPPAESKWSQKYASWVNERLTKSQQKDSSTSRDKNSILRTLKVLSSVLKIYHNLSYDDAMEELSSLVYPSHEMATDIEHGLSQIINRLKIRLESLERVDNPLLVKLEDTLVEKFRTAPDSKAIVFVETKFEATSVDRWIKSRPKLSSIRSGVMTGQKGDAGMMTRAEQSASLSGFRGEECNLLVSTSVLEEGIDVPACNLVIRYQKVTSEIAQVQSRGRARASNSHSISIVSSKSGKKFQELLNEEKEGLVNQALTMLPAGENLRLKMKAKQANILKQEERRKQDTVYYRQLYNPAEVNIHCRSCSAFLCNASDICTIPNTLHYVVKGEEFLSNIRINVHKRSANIPRGLSRTHKLNCMKCEVQDLGVLGKWWSSPVKYPVLKCKHIKFKINGRDFQQFKQWKDVPFQVPCLDLIPS